MGNQNPSSQQFIQFLNLKIDALSSRFPSLAWAGSFVSMRDRFNSHTNIIIEGLFKGNSSLIQPNKKLSVVIIKFSYYLLLEFYRIILAKSLFTPARNKSLTIIRTFAYNSSFENEKFNDQFFTGLTNQISGQVLTLFVPLGSTFSILRKAQKISNLAPIYSYSCLIDPLRVFWVVIQNALNICRNNREMTDQLYLVIEKEVLCDQFSYMNVISLMQYYSLKNLSKKNKIERFYYNLENSIWEKMTLLSLKKYSPSTLVIGHIYGVIPEAATNFFPLSSDISNKLYPSRIVCTGMAPLNILKKYSCYPSNILLEGCSLKLGEKFQKMVKVNSIKKSLLIGVEGLPQSVHMINYVISQMDKMKDWEIILRLHPILPFSKIKSSLNLDNEKTKKLIISENIPLADDFARTGTMIYWGSTLSFEAIMAGIPVIHFKNDYLLSYDPLFELNQFKWVVDKNTDLRSTLEQITSMETDQLVKLQEEAKNYIQSYFSVPTKNRLEDFIG